MANAAAIQRSMLPAPLAPDALGGRAEIFAAMRPARDVGGDFYDYFLLDPDHLVVSLGDVAGKGTPAALFMSATQTALRTVLRAEPDLARALATVNDLLCATNGENMFVTAFCAVVDLATGALTYCSCGHSDAMILRADGALEHPAPTGMALAMLEGAQPRAVADRLGAGDRLLLFSDGLTDAMDTAEQAFGEARLQAAALVTGLLDAVTAHPGAAPQFDDMTALAVCMSTAPTGA